jgi:hypothetical protein
LREENRTCVKHRRKVRLSLFLFRHFYFRLPETPSCTSIFKTSALFSPTLSKANRIKASRSALTVAYPLLMNSFHPRVSMRTRLITFSRQMINLKCFLILMQICLCDFPMNLHRWRKKYGDDYYHLSTVLFNKFFNLFNKMRCWWGRGE